MIHAWADASYEEFTLVFLEPSRNDPDPKDLRVIDFPDIVGTKGLVLACQLAQTHRWAGWVFGHALLHYRNRTRWVAMYDASVGGAIVIQVLCDSKYTIGDWIEVRLNDRFTGQPLRLGAAVPYSKANRKKAPHSQ